MWHKAQAKKITLQLISGGTLFRLWNLITSRIHFRLTLYIAFIGTYSRMSRSFMLYPAIMSLLNCRPLNWLVPIVSVAMNLSVTLANLSHPITSLSMYCLAGGQMLQILTLMTVRRGCQLEYIYTATNQPTMIAVHLTRRYPVTAIALVSLLLITRTWPTTSLRTCRAVCRVHSLL